MPPVALMLMPARKRERESVLMMKSCLQFLLGKKLRTENVTGWLNDKFARLS